MSRTAVVSMQRRDPPIERPLPNSPESEQNVLGGILLDNSLINEAVEVLSPGDFYSPVNRRIFGAMLSLFEQSKKIDSTLLLERLRREAPFEASLLSNLTHGLPYFDHIAEYVEIVLKHSRRRQIARIAEKIRLLALSEDASELEIINAARLLSGEDLFTGSGETVRPIRTVLMSEVESQIIPWLWSPFLALGTFNLLEGEEGLGKTTVCCAIASAIGAGRGLPGVPIGQHIEPSNVLFASAEDSLNYVLKPRLEAANADCSRISATDEPFTLDADGIRSLSKSISLREPKLVIIDPLFSFTGRINLNNDNEVRSVTDQLKRLAEKHHCAILGIRHIGKSKGLGEARNAGLNGIGWRAAARSVLLMGKDPETQERAIRQTKNNLAQLYDKALGFQINDGRFFWTGESHLSAESMLSFVRSETTEERSEKNEAMDFLRDFLRDGKRTAKEVTMAADRTGLSKATLRRAKTALKIVSVKDHAFDGMWFWQLPDGQSFEGSQINTSERLRSTGSQNPNENNDFTEDAHQQNLVSMFTEDAH